MHKARTFQIRGGVFNAGLGGKQWRAIDLLEGDEINASALKDIIRAAVDYNVEHSK